MAEQNKNNATASIDLGTYGCRMLIGLPAKGQDPLRNQHRIISRFSQTVKLNVSSAGVLSSIAKARLIRSLQQCHNLLARYNVQRYRCVGTAGCRAIKDRESFINEVKDETGITLEIISPREEVELACIGAISVFSDKKIKFIFDIGGGSTELGIFSYDRTMQFPKCLACSSLPYGILTLNPIATQDIKNAFAQHVREVARNMMSKCNIYDIDMVQVVTTSGPLATIVTLDAGLRGYHGPQLHGLCMPYYVILHWIDKIERMGSDEFSRTYGISGTMISGLPILRGIIEAVKAPVYISNTGVRDGILKSLFATQYIKDKKLAVY